MDFFRGLQLMLFGALCASAEAKAEFSVQCPQEGSFSAPLQLGDMPNPSAGWDFFLEEATPKRIELSQPPKGTDGSWLVTCYVNIRGGGTIELSSHVSGTRLCSMSGSKGAVTTMPDGSSSCLFDAAGDSCSVNCR